MAVIELSVEDKEYGVYARVLLSHKIALPVDCMGLRTIVHQRRDNLSFWPFSLRIEFLCQFVPTTFVRNSNFGEVIV